MEIHVHIRRIHGLENQHEPQFINHFHWAQQLHASFGIDPTVNGASPQLVLITSPMMEVD